MPTDATMSLHLWSPLLALALNVALGGIALVRNPASRLNRTFAYFISAMALWNLGVFMLRRAPDSGSAVSWEFVIHVGVVTLPAFYYHFVLIFLDSTVQRRRWLVLAYGVSGAFLLLTLTGSPAFVRGVQWTVWGWAPVPGPLYATFIAYFYALMAAGLVHLGVAYRTTGSGFRRHRMRLVLLGAGVTIVGGFVDVIRFALAGAVPAVERLYPLGILANGVCAVMFGLAIVRYRMFDISVAVKRFTLYGAAGTAMTGFLVGITWALEEAFQLTELTAVWIVAPLGLGFALLVTPVGRSAEEWIGRLMFSRPRGCHETLLALSKEMSTSLDVGRLIDTLVQGLVRGIPVTHCALLTYDEASRAFVVCREESASSERVGTTAILDTSRIVEWLRHRDGVLVKEETLLDRTIARYFAPASAELEEIDSALIVPMKMDGAVRGIVLLGEKLSGAIFDGQELELLAVLANQAAVALENARLYERAEHERRRIEVLYTMSRRLASVSESDEILDLIVEETRRLLDAELAALRLVEGEELTLRASTDAHIADTLRPRLRIGESLTGTVMAGNAPVAVEDVLKDARYDPSHRRAAEAMGFHGFLGVPIRASSGAVVGVLYAYTKRQRRFSPEEISLLGAFADQASVLLEKHRLAAGRRHAEEALRQSEKLATMGQLLAGVAHELNNPLTAILGYSELLAGRLRGDALGAFVEQIDTAANRCARIIRNFLALARKHPPERRRVDLNRLVAETVEMLAYQLRLDGVTTRLELAPDLPDLWADGHQLQQVVVNLVTNAEQAMRESARRELTIVTSTDVAGARVVMDVADTGPGISAELESRVFEPFFTTKPLGQGTGLGLSLCQGLIESHGGEIRVGRNADGGALFRIELPIEQRSAMAIEGGAPDAGPDVRDKRVLVVDDEPAVAALLEQWLAVDGHQAETAPNAAVALERLAQRRYDLVISDVRMPGLDGPGLYREAEQRYPASRPPFIFMTGDVLGIETKAFLETSNAQCLSKPFVLDDVRRTVRLALDTAPAP